MIVSKYTKNLFCWLTKSKRSQQKKRSLNRNLFAPKTTYDIYSPIRRWLENIEISNPQLAHRLCQLIPSQCPFAREIKFRSYTLIKIPPLCKLNPLYDELMMLRFRAISYLSDECGEDITCYC